MRNQTAGLSINIHVKDRILWFFIQNVSYLKQLVERVYVFWGEWDKFIGFQNMGKEDLQTIKITHFDLYLQDEVLLGQMKRLLF